MKDKDLLEKLNNINITPNSEWKRKNKEILLSQIHQQDVAEFDINKSCNSFAEWSLYALNRSASTLFAKPVAMVLAILLVVFGGGIASIKASKESKPGDSLYIAKILGEKTQQALTFNERKKTRLNIEFAANRAEELAKLMQEEDENEDVKKEKVEKLKESFKKEIKAAKANLKTISLSEANRSAENNNSEQQEEENKEMGVFSAGTEKEENGVELYNSEKKEIKESAEGQTEEQTETEEESPQEDLSENVLPETILEQAENLFEDLFKEEEEEDLEERNYDDYKNILDKLEEVNIVIEEEGKIKGISEEMLDNGEKKEHNVSSNTTTSAIELNIEN